MLLRTAHGAFYCYTQTTNNTSITEGTEEWEEYSEDTEKQSLTISVFSWLFSHLSVASVIHGCFVLLLFKIILKQWKIQISTTS